MLVGLDQLFDSKLAALRRRLRDSRVGVLTHAAAIDRRGRHLITVLEELGAAPTVVFSPEHGLAGYAQAEEPVAAEPTLATPPVQRSAQRRRRGKEPVAAQAATGDSPATAPALEPSASSAPPATPTAPPEASVAVSASAEPPTAASGDLDQPAAPSTPTYVSLYGATRESLSPQPEDLARLDVLVIDLCDVGSRYYTYVWSALLAVRAAARAGVHVVLLDRPNPIGGDAALAEGAHQEEGFTSFVGLEPLPIRHCLTLAELVLHFAERDGLALGPSGAVSVVPTRGWERRRTAQAWGRPFIPPSPNMPTLDTALVYPGGCLVEGTNLSEGRGTTTPFQLVGAPFLKAAELAAALLEAGVPGALVRPASFRPTFEKHAGVVCHGVMLHVTQPALFRPVATYLRLITLARVQAPEQFQFRTSPYEFESAHPAFDLLTGSPKARAAISSGASPEEVLEGVVQPAADWASQVLEAEARLERASA